MSYDPRDDLPEETIHDEPFQECDHEFSFGICVDCEEVSEDYDGAPQTREEVTAGYVNPSQERLAAWANKQALRR